MIMPGFKGLTKQQKIFRLEFQISELTKSKERIKKAKPLSGLLAISRIDTAIKSRTEAVSYLNELIRTNSRLNPTIAELEEKYHYDNYS